MEIREPVVFAGPLVELVVVNKIQMELRVDFLSELRHERDLWPRRSPHELGWNLSAVTPIHILTIFVYNCFFINS